MTGIIVEFSLVSAAFFVAWRRQVRARERARQREAQMHFEFAQENPADR